MVTWGSPILRNPHRSLLDPKLVELVFKIPIVGAKCLCTSSTLPECHASQSLQHKERAWLFSELPVAIRMRSFWGTMAVPAGKWLILLPQFLYSKIRGRLFCRAGVLVSSVVRSWTWSLTQPHTTYNLMSGKIRLIKVRISILSWQWAQYSVTVSGPPGCLAGNGEPTLNRPVGWKRMESNAIDPRMFSALPVFSGHIPICLLLLVASYTYVRIFLNWRPKLQLWLRDTQ